MTIHTDTRPTLNLIRLPNGQGLDLPTYETRGAAGMDLRAAIDEDKPLVLAPGKRALIPTGFVFEIPEGFEGQVRPRSGLAAKNGVTCLNAPGTVDCDYRGEVKVILVNHGEEDFTITRGMRIAQMVIAAFIQTRIVEVSETTETARGAGGFGSTGV